MTMSEARASAMRAHRSAEEGLRKDRAAELAMAIRNLGEEMRREQSRRATETHPFWGAIHDNDALGEELMVHLVRQHFADKAIAASHAHDGQPLQNLQQFDLGGAPTGTASGEAASGSVPPEEGGGAVSRGRSPHDEVPV